MNKQQSKNEYIKNILKERLYNSLAQAIIKTVLTPYLVLRVILFIFILGTSGLGSYLIIKSIMDYFTFEVITKSRIIFETPALFPKVTFCNVNIFTTEYAFNLTQKGIYNSKKLSVEEKKKLGHDLKDILIFCQFNLIPCNVSDFTWSHDDVYGNCYSFNSGFDSYGNKIKLKQSQSSDPWKGGLLLVLYVDYYERLNFFNETTMNLVTQGYGALIRIENSSSLMYYPNNGIFISPGYQTFISVEREFKSMLPKPYSNCQIDSDSSKFRFDEDFYDLIANAGYQYSQQLCLTQCLQKYFIEKFNCTYPYMLSLYNMSACSWNNFELSLNWESISSNNVINELCLEFCHLECSKNLFKTSISSFKLIENQYLSKIKQNSNLALDFINRSIDAATTEKSFVKLNIFYDSLSYTLTTETARMDFVSLFGSIGGNLGLFLGMSVFSVCEMIEVAIEIFFILRKI